MPAPTKQVNHPRLGEIVLARFEVDSSYLTRVLNDLLNTPSPTGDTDYIVSFIEGEIGALGYTTTKTRKGNLVTTVDGLSESQPRAVTSHIDSLGAVVSEIKSSGRLKMHALNGVVWPTLESEGVNISTRNGRLFRGSIVLENGAAHVNRQARTQERNAETLEVRLDERTTSAEETRLLGIEVGDYVYFDPRVEIASSGFVRSRFLDDKAAVASVITALKALKDTGVSPAQRTSIVFSAFEEVGHGGIDGVPQDVNELVVVDMACIGTGLTGDEYHCTVCIADSGGPYSKALTEKIRSIGAQRGIDLRVDIYPFYSSDGTAYWRAGGEAQVALIGPGVDTSHGYERTHIDALVDTSLLLAEYLVED